jgi:hypothetical protein
VKIHIRISGRDSFYGGKLWHPRCQFRVCREIYPNLRCSVKISLSRSRMSLIIQIIHSHFAEFGIIQSHRRPILEPVKTFISRNECKLEDHSRIINLIWSSLNQTLDDCYLIWARIQFLELRSMSDYFIPSPSSQTECSICRPLINFILLGQLSYVRTKLKTPYRQQFLNITFHLLRLKIRSRSEVWEKHLF